MKKYVMLIAISLLLSACGSGAEGVPSTQVSKIQAPAHTGNIVLTGPDQIYGAQFLVEAPADAEPIAPYYAMMAHNYDPATGIWNCAVISPDRAINGVICLFMKGATKVTLTAATNDLQPGDPSTMDMSGISVTF